MFYFTKVFQGKAWPEHSAPIPLLCAAHSWVRGSLLLNPGVQSNTTHKWENLPLEQLGLFWVSSSAIFFFVFVFCFQIKSSIRILYIVVMKTLDSLLLASQSLTSLSSWPLHNPGGQITEPFPLFSLGIYFGESVLNSFSAPLRCKSF